MKSEIQSAPPPSHEVRLGIHLYCGWAVALLGIIVIIGWYLHVPAIVQIRPAWVPMQFNTALGFLLSGAALILLGRPGAKTFETVFGVALVLLGGTTLAQYFLNVDFGIDQFFVTHDILDHTSHPGRMAPNTAICFLLVGAALIFLHRRRLKFRLISVAVIGALVAALGLLAMIGYAVDFKPAFGWWRLTQMAAHTGLGMFLLGSGLAVWIFTETALRDQRVLGPASVAGFAGGMALTFTLWQALLAIEQKQIHRETVLIAETIRRDLVADFDLRLGAFSRMADRLAFPSPEGPGLWEADVARFLKDFAGYLAIDRVGPQGELTGSITASPAEEGAADRIQRSNPSVDQALSGATSAAIGRPFLSVSSSGNPMEAMLFAIFLTGTTPADGLLLATFDAPALLDEIVSDHRGTGHGIRLRSAADILYQSPPDWTGLVDRPGLTAALPVLLENLALSLDVVPFSATVTEIRSAFPTIALLGGILLSAVFAFTLELKRIGRTRADQLAEKNQTLWRLNRSLSAINSCNQASVRARDENELLAEICRAIVEYGGYPLAWVGFSRNDPEKSICPIACYGVEKNYLESLPLTWEDKEHGRGPTGTALRTGHTAVCDDTETDSKFGPWRDEARQKGLRSSIAIPMEIEHGTSAVLCIYSREPRAFSGYEKELLERLARDLEVSLRGLRALRERDQAARALKQSEERYRSLVTATAQIIWTTDANGIVHEDIPSWRQFTGQTYAEIQGTGWAEAVHPDDRQTILDAWQEAIRTCELFDVEYRIRRHDGLYHHFSVRGVPVIDANGNVREWIGACADITPRKEAEVELRAQAETLRRSNHELEQFAYVASHDLQEPLRMVSNYCRLLGRRYKGKLDQDADEFIEFAVDGARRMQQLIDDLLTYSRVGTRGKYLVPVNAEDGVLEAMRRLSQLVQDRKASVTWDQPLPMVQADEGQLAQLFQNLVGNAIKFCVDEAPIVRISARFDSGEADDAAVYPSPKWIFSVSDNGIGIDPSYFDRIFVIFQRLHSKERFPGTGIGLAICRKIVDRHGGRIWVESEPGKGTTFHFSLPAVTETERQETTELNPASIAGMTSTPLHPASL